MADPAEPAGGRDWVGEARAAAARRDPVRMAEALYRSDALDGLARRLQAKWDTLSPEDIDDVVGEAVDVAYERVQSEPVLALIAFLWRVADRKASDLHLRREREAATDLAAAEAAGELAGARLVVRDVDTGVPDELDAVEARRWAIAVARTLVAQLGQQNVQHVMTYVLDGIEKDAYEITNQEIAVALGLSLGTVRTSLSRGFRRLARVARQRGIADLIIEIEGVVGDPDEEEDDDDD